MAARDDSDDGAAANAERATQEEEEEDAAEDEVEGDSPQQQQQQQQQQAGEETYDDSSPPATSRRRRTTTRKRSLAFAPTTPCLAALLISITTLATHVLFFYAQTAPMWKLQVTEDIHVWANATSTKAKWAFDTVGVPRHNSFDLTEDRDVQQFTYMYSIQQLWRGKGLSGALLSKTTAVLLVFCSGIWPHLKLFLLHCTWLFPMRSPLRRQRFLHWLSTLGKWSLADVLSVCVMLAVVDVEWIVDPAAIKQGLIRQTPLVISLIKALYSSNDLCSYFLNYDCANPHKIDHIAKCKACKTLVHDAYTHPSWAKDTGKLILDGVETSGGGQAQLSVVGMRGIYAFCIAVIMSILLSLIVDVYDMRARRAQARLDRTNSSGTISHDSTSDENNNINNNNNTLTQSLLQHDHYQLAISNGGGGGDDYDAINNINVDPLLAQHRLLDGRSNPPPVPDVFFRAPEPLYKQILKNVYPVVTFLVVMAALLLHTMVRKAEGALPTLAQEIIGMKWNDTFSVQSLVAMTGLAGGWDILLRSTCSLFIIIGPALRALLCILDFSGWTPDRFRRPLTLTIDFIGAFCAWEVIFVSIIMTGLLLPDITSTIVNMPQCRVVSPKDGVCFKLYFTVQAAFALVAVGGFMLVLESVYAVYAGHRAEAEREELELQSVVSGSGFGGGRPQQMIKVDGDFEQGASTSLALQQQPYEQLTNGEEEQAAGAVPNGSSSRR